MCVVSDDVTSECNGSAFVTSQHFLCLLLLNLIQFTTPDRNAQGGQGQWSQVNLNNNFNFKLSPLRILQCPSGSHLVPWAASVSLTGSVAAWQWVMSEHTGRILSGTWWLYTGAAYLIGGLTGGTVAGERGVKGRRKGKGRRVNRAW